MMLKRLYSSAAVVALMAVAFPSYRRCALFIAEIGMAEVGTLIQRASATGEAMFDC